MSASSSNYHGNNASLERQMPKSTWNAIFERSVDFWKYSAGQQSKVHVLMELSGLLSTFPPNYIFPPKPFRGEGNLKKSPDTGQARGSLATKVRIKRGRNGEGGIRNK